MTGTGKGRVKFERDGMGRFGRFTGRDGMGRVGCVTGRDGLDRPVLLSRKEVTQRDWTADVQPPFLACLEFWRASLL